MTTRIQTICNGAFSFFGDCCSDLLLLEPESLLYIVIGNLELSRGLYSAAIRLCVNVMPVSGVYNIFLCDDGAGSLGRCEF